MIILIDILQQTPPGCRDLKKQLLVVLKTKIKQNKECSFKEVTGFMIKLWGSMAWNVF